MATTEAFWPTVAAKNPKVQMAAGPATVKPVLGYPAIRGLGEPIRALHAYLKIELEEKLYGTPFLPKATLDFAKWSSDKADLNMALPNFPYYIDGDLKLTETAAIMRYVCEKHAPDLLLAPGFPPLVGKAKHDQVFTFLFYANNGVRSYHYGFLPQTRSREGKSKDGRTGGLHFKDVWTEEKNREMNAVALEQVTDALDAGKRAQKESGVSGPLIFGATPTAADIVLYEHLCLVQCQAPEVADLEEVCAFRRAFEALPGILEYLKSPTRLVVPINAPMALFGASMDEASPYAMKAASSAVGGA